VPVGLASPVTLLKEDALATCCVLSLAEDALSRLGQPSLAAELGRAFQLLEGRLLVPQASDASGS
jgi:hypothetical protein